MVARIWRTAHAARQALLDLLFPPRCVVCRGVDAAWFCPACRAQVEKILPPLCDRCGRPLHRPECPYCRKLPLTIDGIRAIAFFEGNLRRAVHAFKYEQRPELAGVLGQMLSDYLAAHSLPVDVITAVPLHAERERARGFNQAVLLARALGVRQNLPVWDGALARDALASRTRRGGAARERAGRVRRRDARRRDARAVDRRCVHDRGNNGCLYRRAQTARRKIGVGACPRTREVIQSFCRDSQSLRQT